MFDVDDAHHTFLRFQYQTLYKMKSMAIKIRTNQFAEVKNPVTYAHYVSIIEKLVLRRKTSGSEQTEEKISATIINLQRMKRLIKETSIDPELIRKVSELECPMLWITLTEAWCGDAAQNLPIIHKIAELSKNKIKLMLVFRDENPELMSYFMTDGKRSIPKLICMNGETLEVLGTWGPRPQSIQNIINNFKNENPGATHKEIMYHLHLSYFHDKGHALQSELSKMMDECSEALCSHEIGH
jgi:hypothetical protein